jgi:DNA transposition AAA+ family ATPase
MVTTSPVTPAAETEVKGSPRNPTNRFRLPADVVQNAIADLPEEQRITLRWFATWCNQHVQYKEDLGRVLKKASGHFYSTDSIIALLTGSRVRRGENIEPMLDAIHGLRRVEDLRADQVGSGFIETRLYKEIERRCEKALKRQRIAFIFGDSQIGKTWSLKEYARRHNHGETIYVEMPSTGSLGGLLKVLAGIFNIPEVMNQGQQADRIIECFDSRMLLIIDEAHNALKGRNLAALAFVRELWNRRQCGVVLSMTNEGKNIFLRGPQAKQLEQMWRRRITPLQLPSATPADDAALFAEAYGLTPAEDKKVTIKVSFRNERGDVETKEHDDNPLRLQTEILSTEGLGVWISILQDAADTAQESRKPITWGAVIKAHCQSIADAEMLD